ncbi:hypothetical protein [Aeromonas dhakensis]|uniref:hypothetical protein n=1 Tax=Aeromonas dhakensis TaxID=196024 RepID=UPI003D6B80F0
MPSIISDSPIYTAISELNKATAEHNLTFDESSQVFKDVEASLQRINIEDWYPQQLYLWQFSNNQPINISLANVYTPPQPFSSVSYQLGFFSKRLVIREIVSHYDYERDVWGNVMQAPFSGFPYTKKIRDEIGDAKPVSDCTREIRAMVIANLPSLLEYIRTSLSHHTQTLRWALNNM